VQGDENDREEVGEDLGFAVSGSTPSLARFSRGSSRKSSFLDPDSGARNVIRLASARDGRALTPFPPTQTKGSRQLCFLFISISLLNYNNLLILS
jgi:hypothetical protein